MSSDLDKTWKALNDYVDGRITVLELCALTGVPYPENKRIKTLVRGLLEAQPPPVVGDYGSEPEENAAIEARDYVRDWYRQELQQIVKGFKDD